MSRNQRIIAIEEHFVSPMMAKVYTSTRRCRFCCGG